ncbi:MAG: hypothetical protein ABSA84_03140 [Gammaproteobacteria bacterium]|jgi:hypothetical protein
MIKLLSLSIITLGLSACAVVPEERVYYQGPNPVVVYPAQPFVEESIVIGGMPYYRYYHNGHYYYHHSPHHRP